MRVETLCVVLGLCLGSSVATPFKTGKKITMAELRDLVAEFSNEERNTFIRAKIDLGYKIEYQGESADNEEGTLAVQIFDYFVENQDAILKRKQITDSIIVAQTVCYPEPIGCIDPDDPGVRP